MTSDARFEVTTLLASGGETAGWSQETAAQLMPLVYDELRRIARLYLRGERADHTLQPTALVHEAYLRLADQSHIDWRGRAHFRAVGAKVMRQILIDHARRHGAKKRGGGRRRVTLEEWLLPGPDPELELAQLLTVNEALDRLGGLDQRQARVVELRLFGGLSMKEMAEALQVSKRTVEGDWMHGCAWLRAELSGD